MGEAKQKRIARAAEEAAIEAERCLYGLRAECPRPARRRIHDIIACDRHWVLIDSMAPTDEWDDDYPIEREMQKLKAMGVTISVRPSPVAPGTPNRPVHIILDSAREAGILEEDDA